MRRKYKKLRKKENVIAFPGMYEKLVGKGTRYVELGKYEQAVEAFDQAMVFAPLRPDFLGPYTVALYETKDYHRAKEMASMDLHGGTPNYLEVMELYATICIQLQEYDEVEILLETIMEEELVPPSLMPKFTYLQELNTRLSVRYPKEDEAPVEAAFTFDEFLAVDHATQRKMLASLERTEIGAMTEVLVDIVESVHLSPLLITFALTLLYQAHYTEVVTVRKLGEEMSIVPAKITLPGQNAQTQEVLEAIEELLDKDPSRLELAHGLVEKFNITAYPFSWGDYEPAEIAMSYVHYIESLFSEAPIPDTPLCRLIEKVDKESDFDNM